MRSCIQCNYTELKHCEETTTYRISSITGRGQYKFQLKSTGLQFEGARPLFEGGYYFFQQTCGRSCLQVTVPITHHCAHHCVKIKLTEAKRWETWKLSYRSPPCLQGNIEPEKLQVLLENDNKHSNEHTWQIN